MLLIYCTHKNILKNLIINLNKFKKKKICGKVCIIGAGTVGLFIAHQFRIKKIPTIICEAGEVQNLSRKQFFNYKFKNLLYAKNILKKKITLGGTSTLWAGQMLPFQKFDIIKRRYIDIDGWNIKYKEIKKNFYFIKKFFNFKFINKKFKYYKFISRKFDVRFSTFIPLKKRNFKNFLLNKTEDENEKIFINAKVIKINNKKEKNKNNFSVKSIIAKSSNGNILEIEADILIICCGALESTRLLLLYNRNNGNFIDKQGSPLGNFFSEILSFKYAEFLIKDWKKFNLFFSPIYKHKLMHNPRFELCPDIQKRFKTTSCYCNILFINSKKYWLDLLKKNTKKKNIYKILIFYLFNIKSILVDMYYFFIFRIIYKLDWFHKPYRSLLNVVVEQIPNFNNKLSINNEGELIIDWKIYKQDIQNIKKTGEVFTEAWINSEMKNIADIKLNFLENINTKEIEETNHPIGTIRAGTKIKNSVLDKNLKLWNVDNLYVCSTATFKTSGSSNTGFTLLCLAFRLVKHINKVYLVKNKTHLTDKNI
jgi:hypothetical protein